MSSSSSSIEAAIEIVQRNAVQDLEKVRMAL
jgi:hypothetical protein